MKEGLSVWLDVPLDALARRIAAVGTDSRPLLHQEPGDPYTKVTTLSIERKMAGEGEGRTTCHTITYITYLLQL